MIVCVCHNVSDKAIRATALCGARSLKEARAQVCFGNSCGKCLPSASLALAQGMEQAGIALPIKRRLFEVIEGDGAPCSPPRALEAMALARPREQKNKAAL